MQRAVVRQVMPVSAEAVFDVVHDLRVRLQWDTLLSEARMTRGSRQPGLGETSLCRAKPWLGGIGIETRYVTFRPGEVAAVQMINHPPMFSSFNASIRHEAHEPGSLVVYTLNFEAQPRWLAPLLEPVMLRVLEWETRKRLKSLARFLADTPA